MNGQIRGLMKRRTFACCCFLMCVRVYVCVYVCVCVRVCAPRTSIRITGDLVSHWASLVWQEQTMTVNPPPTSKRGPEGRWRGKGEMTLELGLYLGHLLSPPLHPLTFIPLLAFNLCHRLWTSLRSSSVPTELWWSSEPWVLCWFNSAINRPAARPTSSHLRDGI